MATQVTLDIVCGSINSAQGSGKAFVFHTPLHDSVRAGCKETYLLTALQESSSLGARVSFSRGAARRNVMGEIGGNITVSQLMVTEGEVLKVFAQRKSAGWNGVMRTACLFIRLRAGAPLNKVHILIPSMITDATQAWYVSGRFEVMEPELAEAMGAKILNACRGHHTDHAVSGMFTVEELAPALSTIREVKVKQVGNRAMPVARARRKMELV